MAKRIGKYKVSNKESTLSIADGGTVDGALTLSGAITATGLGTTSGSASGVLFTTASAFVTASQAGDATLGIKSFKVVCMTD